MTYYELTPAYGRDYQSAKEVKKDWELGMDFNGDYQLGFKPVNLEDMRNDPEISKPFTVLLRYRKNTQVASVKVSDHV